MKIKKNDKVKMLSGKDRGKTGKVIFVLNKEDEGARVVVEGLNKIKKHQRPKKQGQKGQIVSVERAVAISTVQLVCPSCGKPTRVGQKIDGKNKTRVCKKCGAVVL
ncbi:MAG: 50S ribosomal protein L24 [Candidatus Yanofskybacteria bacterium]|nr:50S ribosomal protein L24 [Candidatus Yanofskybacteria bacterium]